MYAWMLGVLVVGIALGGSSQAQLKRESFATDPAWEGVNNRAAEGKEVVAEQDFGYSATNHAGGSRPGEIGGTISRAIAPAWYGKPIPEKTLKDHLRVSGKWCIPEAQGGSGVLIGWFREDSTGWRTPNSMVVRIDGNGGKYWVFFEYGTKSLFTGCGETFEGDRYQTTTSEPYRTGKEVHDWSLEYDPEGADGLGQVTFTLDKETFAIELAEGHKQDDAMFNRFGILNVQTSGDSLKLYLDDVVLDGEELDFDSDPEWEGSGNRERVRSRFVRPYHDFGWSPTAYAGGRPGELGGVIWRIENDRDHEMGYYGDKVGPLSLVNELKATGRMSFRKAGSDSAAAIGWFSSKTPIGAPPRNFMGILIEGPSRVGHYFRPMFSNAAGEAVIGPEGPVTRPVGEVQSWGFHYDPNANGGRGVAAAVLDGESATISLPKGLKEGGAEFDRFGMISFHQGGHHVEVYFDDLEYTTAP